MKHRLFPFTSWLPEVKDTWKSDVIAGVLVSIILIPQALAYSQMAGMPAYYGLYASFIPMIIASLWGSSRLLSTGPAVVVSLLSLSAVSVFAPANSAEFVMYTGVLTLLVGVLQFCMGVLKAGNSIHFISHPVILGFVNASALLIILSQMVHILGIPSVRGHHEIFSLLRFFEKGTTINFESLLIGVIAIGLLILAKDKKIKALLPLFVIVFATVYSWFFQYSGAIVGVIPSGLPHLTVPTMGWQIILQLFRPALIIALVSYMNGVSVAKTVAFKTKEVIVGNQELIGQGLANIAAGLFGSSPVGGSLSRTSLNWSMGAKTGFASIVSGLMVGFVLLFFTKTLTYVPQTVLAAIIIVSVVQLFDVQKCIHLFKKYKYDGWVAILTFVATVISSPNLELGVIIGIVASGAVYIHRSSYSSIIVFKANDKKTAKKNGILFQQFPSNARVLAVSIDRSLIFTNAEHVTEKILYDVLRSQGIQYIMLMCRSVNFVDATAIETLESLVISLREKNITVVMVSLHPEFWDFVKKLPFYDVVGKENFFKKANEALKDISKR